MDPAGVTCRGSDGADDGVGADRANGVGNVGNVGNVVIIVKVGR